MGWTRVGKCPPERCEGRCCEHIGIWYDDTPEAREFLTVLQVRGVKVIEGGGKFLAQIPQRCRYLTEGGLCGLHPSMEPHPSLPSRPQFCWDWPSEPSQLVNDPHCGFSFVWSEEPALVGIKE